VVVGVGYVFIGDGWTNIGLIYTQQLIKKLNVVTLFPRSKVKIKGKINHFMINPEQLD